MRVTRKLLAVAALAGLTACGSKGDEEGASLLSGGSIDAATKAQDKASQPPAHSQASSTALPSSGGSTEAGRPKAAAGKGVVQWSRAVKSTSRHVAIEELAKGNFFESVVSEVEGFRPSLYNDNTGYAIGNGWNVSLQSAKTNQRISDGVGLVPAEAMALTALSGKLSTSSLPSVSITPEQATKAAQLMRPQYEEPIKAMIGSGYDQLKPNEKAVLAYHVYKVGPGGAAKYKTLLANLRAYVRAPSPEISKKVAEGFTYSYMLNGERRYDTRSQVYMAALWLDPEVYGYLLGRNAAPADFKQTAKVFAQKVDPTKPADEQIKDDIEEIKAQLFSKGIAPTIEIEAPVANPSPCPAGQRTGVNAAWY